MVSYLASHFCAPFAKYAATFFRQLASPLLALHSQARSLLISTDSLRKPSSPLGGGMIPAVPAHPAHHSSGPADHKKQPPTRSSGPFTRDLTHNPQPRAHPSTTLPTQPHPVPPPEHRAPTVQEKPLTPDQPSSLAEEWSCGNQTRAYQTHHASTTHAPRNPADTGERPGGPPDPRPGTGGPPHPAHLTASTPISVSRRFALQSH